MAIAILHPAGRLFAYRPEWNHATVCISQDGIAFRGKEAALHIACAAVAARLPGRYLLRNNISRLTNAPQDHGDPGLRSVDSPA
jgi:hypothetical protein